jgi:hypothetical protein
MLFGGIRRPVAQLITKSSKPSKIGYGLPKTEMAVDNDEPQELPPIDLLDAGVASRRQSLTHCDDIIHD